MTCNKQSSSLQQGLLQGVQALGGTLNAWPGCVQALERSRTTHGLWPGLQAADQALQKHRDPASSLAQILKAQQRVCCVRGTLQQRAKDCVAWAVGAQVSNTNRVLPQQGPGLAHKKT